MGTLDVTAGMGDGYATPPVACYPLSFLHTQRAHPDDTDSANV
jgi:hypothetical protein